MEALLSRQGFFGDVARQFPWAIRMLAGVSVRMAVMFRFMISAKIETVPHWTTHVLQLSGRIESRHVQDLKARTESRTYGIVLDQEEVRGVDLDVVHFLAVCEAKGIKLRHCPPYIRHWILMENPWIKEFE